VTTGCLLPREHFAPDPGSPRRAAYRARTSFRRMVAGARIGASRSTSDILYRAVGGNASGKRTGNLVITFGGPQNYSTRATWRKPESSPLVRGDEQLAFQGEQFATYKLSLESQGVCYGVISVPSGWFLAASLGNVLLFLH